MREADVARDLTFNFLRSRFVSVSDISHESLLLFYDNIRAQVEAERGSQYKFMTADSIKEYAESLRTEIFKRGLRFMPIDWGTDQPSFLQVKNSEASDLSRPGGNEFNRSGDTVEANMTQDRRHVDEVSENLRRSIDALMKSRT
jgi:hypothetical protein